METKRARLGTLLGALRLTLWFLPGLMALGGVALFGLTYALDLRVSEGASFPDLPIFFSGGADAARALLSAIVGSLITVIATVFSVTIVTLQLASSSYSPRLLQRFMTDRLVQATLGTYAATFVYAILVLRIVRTPQGAEEAFTPIVSVPVALVLALVSVGLLIYFVHHIANMSQSSAIVQAVHDDACAAIAKLEPLGDVDEEGAETREERPADPPVVVLAEKSGYVRNLDLGVILEVVTRKGGTAFVEVPAAPGEFVTAGLPLALLWPPKGERNSPEEERIRRAIVVGPERTVGQDLAFGIRQLADICLKGLSPGINDPTTTVQSLHLLGAVFVQLGSRALPPRVVEHEGADGSRVVAFVANPTFDQLVGLAFDQTRRAALSGGQVAVLEELLKVLRRALAANGPPERQGALWKRAHLLARQSARRIPDEHDASSICREAVAVGAPLLRTTALRERVASDLEDLASLCDENPYGKHVREAVGAATAGLAAEGP